MIYTGNLLLNEFKEAMQSEFEMNDLSLMKYFLGIEVEQSEKRNFYFSPIATGTKLSNQNEGTSIHYTLYKRIVGYLMYLTATRLDIMYEVSLI